MSDAPDAELLKEFVRNQAEAAFTELVRRHIGLVHSVALRHTTNPQYAEDITQAVFIILARKASSLGSRVILSGWLYHTARLTAANFKRAEMRRIQREQEAFMQSTQEEPASEALWHELSLLLDEAMARLGAGDRDAIVLRFFQNRSLAELGTAMGIAERAAQKRVNRALEKLHKFFTKRGVVSTAAIIAGVISANSVQAAPPLMVQSVVTIALAKSAAASASTLALVKGALKTMAWAKAQIAIFAGMGILLIGGTTTAIVKASAHASPAGLPPIPAGPQVITLDDGTKLTLLGTTFGSHHMAPGYENLTTANWIYTASNTTVVWIKEESQPNQQPTYELMVSDPAKTGSVNLEARQRSFVKPGVFLQSFVLSAFPRWDTETILRVRLYRGTIAKGKFVLPNPAPGTFAQWTPKPLPDTESDGDLQVTLTKLVAGVPEPYREGEKPAPTNDPALQIVHLNFDFTQNGKPTTNWDPWPVQTTDAAGNRSGGLIYAYPTNGILPSYPDRVHPSFPLEYDGYYYQPGLWPDEPWKVRLEFIRRSNFSDDEIVTFTNIPVKVGTQKDFNDEWTGNPNNFPYVPATVNGVHLKLLPPLLLSDQYSTGHPKDIGIIIGANPGFNPKGMNLTVVAATDDQGRKLWSFEQPSWAGHYSIEFARVPEDIKSLNLKLALHKSRFVEFTVQPTKQ